MSKLEQLYDIASDLNDRVIPGPGKLFGVNPKKDFITPLDAVPFAGPLNKLNKGRKLLMSSRAGKWIASGLFQLGSDIAVVGGILYGYSQLGSGGSGAPATSPNTHRSSTHRTGSARKRCPSGFRRDPRTNRCVRIRSRNR